MRRATASPRSAGLAGAGEVAREIAGREEPQQHLQPLGKLLVRERVHQRARLGNLAVHPGQCGGVVASQATVRGVRDRHGGRRLQHPVAGGPRGVASLAGKRLGRIVVAARRPLTGHREGERRGYLWGAVIKCRALCLQQAARLLAVVQPQRLEVRERLDHAYPVAGRVGREHGEHPPQRVTGLDRTPGRHQRPPLGAQQLEPTPVMFRPVGQQPQRGLPPPGRGRRGDSSGLLGRRHQQLDRREISRTGGALYMVRALGRRRAPRRQRLGGPGVRRQPPAAPRPLVHRAAHQRMTKAEPPRLAGRPHKLRSQQLVERSQRDLLLDARCGRGQLHLERVARHRRALQHSARLLRQHRQLARQRRLHRPRHAGQPGRCAPDRPELGGPCQLHKVERVTATLPVETLARRRAGIGQQPRRRLERQRAELEQHTGPAADRVRQRRLQPRRPPRTRRQPQQHAAAGGPVKQQRQHVRRRRIGPLHVVDQQCQRPLGR